MTNRFQPLFEQITTKVENNPTGFGSYLRLFFALLALRLALEFFSSQRLFTLDDIIHIGLWFIFIVLAFLLQLHLFSGENILKISKLVITFFVIALVAPLIDLLFYQGQGAKMNYLSLNNWHQAAWSYVTMGGSNFNRGATLGIRVEIFLLVLACFNYVRTKRQSMFIGLIAAWSIYTILFLSGTIPVLLGLLIDEIGLQYQNNDQSTILLLLTFDLLLLFIVLHRFSSVFLTKLFEHVKPGPLMLAILYLSIGVTLARIQYGENWSLTPTTLFWFPLGIGLSLCFIVLVFARKIKTYTIESVDKKPIINNTALIILIIGSSFISYQCFFTTLLSWSIIYIYYEKPFELFKIIFVRNIIIGLLFTSFAIIGFCTFRGPMTGFPAKWILLLFGNAFATCLSFEIIQKNYHISEKPFLVAIHKNLYFRVFILLFSVFLSINLLIQISNLIAF